MLVFRLPFQKDFYTLGNNSSLHSVEFIAFDEKQKINFNGNLQKINEQQLLKNEIFSKDLPNTTVPIIEEKKENYLNKISKVIQFIKDKDLKKLVISRIKVLELNDESNISLTKTFLNLSENYPNAFVYLFKKEECWLGAFSELLGKFNKQTSEFETMSLAGTLPLREEWSPKEIEEQKPVTEYITNILNQYSDSLQISEIKDHFSGNIKHLRTDFKLKINPKDLEVIIGDLHPTPAVCGIPKEFCKNAINQFEYHSRKLYSGYIRVETDTEIQYFVNLRCAEFTNDKAYLYVGGGITPLSNPEKEWRETELKSEAILKHIIHQ